MGMALKSLGYSLNSEKETELRAALQKLLELRKQSIWLSDELSIAPELVSGQAVMGMGWAEDFWLVQKVYEDAQYVLPAEGGVLWGDNFVIPFNASNKAAAEQFINFCLRPEISARIIAGNHYMMANEAALPLLDTEITGDLVINPTNEQLKNAEILLPHSPAGQELFDKIWQEFLDAE
jgi:spermidine/putrescine transport system substrate-binding protein